jgi:hypothetical protein
MIDPLSECPAHIRYLSHLPVSLSPLLRVTPPLLSFIISSAFDRLSERPAYIGHSESSAGTGGGRRPAPRLLVPGPVAGVGRLRAVRG